MNDFQRYLAEEFAEDYEEGRLSRRDALKLIVSVTGSLLVADSLLAGCSPVQQAGTQAVDTPTQPAAVSASGNTETPAANTPTSLPTQAEPTLAQPTRAATEQPATPAASPQAYGTVNPDDPQIQAGSVEFPAEDGTSLQAYLARPAGAGPDPVILVCHENRGLTSHIQDVARRLAKAGYVALAVDLLSRQGGTAAVGSDNVPGALGNMPPEQFIQDFLAGWRYLQDQAFAQADRVGMVGFCFGGGVTWRVATQMPELLAAVPFYGPHPPVEDVPMIQAAVLAIYAGRDQRINAGIPAIEAAMQEHNKIYEKIIYPDVDHAFHNDTGSRYNPEAARDAWAKTLAWFERYVRNP